mmetsp:Transcript_6372/g.25731  ORF Transcript_6372/g.25731 Transcript_6372/m.25731 type:complete len:269 (+) Transcript_6372:839-1645(+)
MPRAASIAKRSLWRRLRAVLESCSSLLSEPRAQNSITRLRSPGAVLHTPKRRTTLGWRRLASTAASCSNASRSSSPESVSQSCLRATSVPFHLPRSTSPKPPRPIRPAMIRSQWLIFMQPDAARRSRMPLGRSSSSAATAPMPLAAAALASRSKRSVSRSRRSSSRSASSCESAITALTGSSEEKERDTCSSGSCESSMARRSSAASSSSGGGRCCDSRLARSASSSASSSLIGMPAGAPMAIVCCAGDTCVGACSGAACGGTCPRGW